MTVRVLIADDQPLILAGLRTVVQAEPDTEVLGEARDGQQAVTLGRQLLPAVVLIDIRMPLLDGLAATREITSLRLGRRQPAPLLNSCPLRRRPEASRAGHDFPFVAAGELRLRTPLRLTAGPEENRRRGGWSTPTTVARGSRNQESQAARVDTRQIVDEAAARVSQLDQASVCSRVMGRSLGRRRPYDGRKTRVLRNA